MTDDPNTYTAEDARAASAEPTEPTEPDEPGWPVLALAAYLLAFTAFALWLQLAAPGILETLDKSHQALDTHVVFIVASATVLRDWLPVFIGLTVVLGALFIDRKRRVRIGQICAGLFALVVVVGFVQILVLVMAASAVPAAPDAVFPSETTGRALDPQSGTRAT